MREVLLDVGGDLLGEVLLPGFEVVFGGEVVEEGAVCGCEVGGCGWHVFLSIFFYFFSVFFSFVKTSCFGNGTIAIDRNDLLVCSESLSEVFRVSALL